MFGTIRAGGNADAPQYTIGNIPDGTSNTIGFAEQLGNQPVTCCGNLWAYPGIDWSAQYTPVIANTRSYGTVAYNTPQGGVTPSAADKRLVNSGHTGTTQVGLMDGSVRGVSNSVTQTTWQYALQPADN